MDEIAMIDWNSAVKKAGSKEKATILLQLFVAQLSDIKKDINHYIEKGSLFKLEDTLHKLLGGCNYCCIPKLESMLQEFYKVVKCMSEIDRVLLKIYQDELNKQIATILAEYKNSTT